MYDDIIKDTWGERVRLLRELLKIQCQNGNWDYDPYMHGMANGMIFALSVMENDNHPEFLNAPKEWGCDRVKRMERGKFHFMEWYAIMPEENKNERENK